MTVAPSRMTLFWQLWLAAIVFVFPIPHTIGLRNLLILAGLVVLLWTSRHTLPRLAAWLKPAALWLLALTSWIVFHSAAVASAPSMALDQFRANWLMPLLIAFAGAWAVVQLPRQRAAQAVTAALSAHMLGLLAWQFKLWLSANAWPFKATPFAAYDYHGTLNSFFLTLLVVDRLFWLLEKYSPLALGRRAGWALLLLSLVSDVALQSRNSSVITVSLLLAVSVVLLNGRLRDWRVVAAAMGLAAVIGAGSISFDDRWQGLRESVATGWASPSSCWLSNDAVTPCLAPSGAIPEESAYLRAAWTREAIGLIAAHPMGIGFGHDAFGRGLALKYGHGGFGSSHSGWLDFALGTGLAGLALLLATATVATRSCWLQFRQRQDAEALLLAFFVSAYMLRCLLDGHLSGWRLGLFAFICGVLIGSMRERSSER